jgi:GT2 family glycosyltransferase
MAEEMSVIEKMKKTLFICMPCGKNVDTGFFRAFCQSIGEIMMNWNTAVLTESSPFIVENRNQLAAKVIEFDSKSVLKVDYVLWIDTDMIFSFEQVKQLLERLEEGNDIVSGLCYNIFDGKEKPVVMKKAGQKYVFMEEKVLKNKELIEVDAAGFAFIAFKAEVLKKLQQKYGRRIFDIRYLENGSLVGEDQVFCERAKEAGYKIMLDSAIVVKHIKGTIPSKAPS